MLGVGLAESLLLGVMLIREESENDEDDERCARLIMNDMINKTENKGEGKKIRMPCLSFHDKAGYTATPVACGWAGAVFEDTGSFGQEQ